MGQGTDSCGGYEVEYDEYEDALCSGMWVQSDGSSIKPSDMSVSHLRNTKRICENLMLASSFECDQDKWQDWVDIFADELSSRGELQFHVAKYTSTGKVKHTRGTKLELICHCGNTYSPRLADLKRGWARSCSKRCASIKRDYGRPDPKCATTGKSIKDLLKEKQQ